MGLKTTQVITCDRCGHTSDDEWPGDAPPGMVGLRHVGGSNGWLVSKTIPAPGDITMWGDNRFPIYLCYRCRGRFAAWVSEGRG
jgi:hypothetical protein